jgi:hypothetical protein
MIETLQYPHTPEGHQIRSGKGSPDPAAVCAQLVQRKQAVPVLAQQALTNHASARLGLGLTDLLNCDPSNGGPLPFAGSAATRVCKEGRVFGAICRCKLLPNHASGRIEIAGSAAISVCKEVRVFGAICLCSLLPNHASVPIEWGTAAAPPPAFWGAAAPKARGAARGGPPRPALPPPAPPRRAGAGTMAACPWIRRLPQEAPPPAGAGTYVSSRACHRAREHQQHQPLEAAARAC